MARMRRRRVENYCQKDRQTRRRHELGQAREAASRRSSMAVSNELNTQSRAMSSTARTV